MSDLWIEKKQRRAKFIPQQLIQGNVRHWAEGYEGSTDEGNRITWHIRNSPRDEHPGERSRSRLASSVTELRSLRDVLVRG